ncbi:MAG TPA: 2-amino-4-hydroxy-6-hydroxymethyldihydropteridine diphosphokinase [Acidimicrobiia bacterium]|nr:2-amino-4-hydroxy-6-hydroxymethyldihydropteridine diphosphokinase [Acidimicrobiia bacterium]
MRATVALGSNLGDRLQQLRTAVAGLRRLGDVVDTSSLYETDPVGGPAQGRYLNAVVLLETALDPEALLQELHRLEGDSDRTRDVRWGPRTLDLDLITYGDRRISQPLLVVPHPRAHERRFVLAPMLEVAPDAPLANGQVARDAITSTLDQRIQRWEGSWERETPALGVEAGWWVVAQFGLLLLWLVVVLFTAEPDASPWLFVGVPLAVAGIALGIGAIVSFAAPVSPSPQPREGASLVDRGVYRFVRHPMYGALILATSGAAIAARAWAGVAVSVVLAGVLRLKSAREERILGVVLGGYRAYARSVRRRFLPGIW